MAIAGRDLLIYEHEQEPTPDDTREQILRTSTWHRWLAIQPATPYQTFLKKLPSGHQHGLLFPVSATPRRTSSTTKTLLLPRTDAPQATTKFFHLLDATLSLPLHPSWAEWLWQLFTGADWIEALTGAGSWIGWNVQWDLDALQAHLTRAIADGSLSVPAVP